MAIIDQIRPFYRLGTIKNIKNTQAPRRGIWFFKPKVFRTALLETLVPGCLLACPLLSWIGRSFWMNK